MKPYIINKIRKRLKLSSQLDNWLTKRFPTIFFQPHMSNDEFKLFKKHTMPAMSILEFGSGGSTFFFLNNRKKLISVENNEAFFNYLGSFSYIKNKISKGLLNFIRIDTGISKEWGIPVNEIKKDNWPLYYNKIWQDYPEEKPNAIFIDGRFRVMCALTVLDFIDSSVPVIIHDFFGREYYNILLNFYDIKDQADSMAVLQKKDTIDLITLYNTKKRFEYDYR